MEEGLDLEEIAIMEETNQVLGLERITPVEVILEEANNNCGNKGGFGLGNNNSSSGGGFGFS